MNRPPARAQTARQEPRSSALGESGPHSRAAFTLVELLVVISIISILASTLLLAMYGVMEDAKETRTRAEIVKLNALLMTQWESYRTRPVPVRIPAAMLRNPTQGMSWAAKRRLYALRELMRMEMPDRKTDLMFPDPYDTNEKPRYLINEPALWRAYIRRASAAIQAKHSAATAQSWKSNDYWTPLYENAECLYLIIANMRETESSALDFFREREIGDTDDDGMPEILDGWGRPIRFLRWAPGFRSDIQTGDWRKHPDPFDPLKIDPRFEEGEGTFALFPLVYSAGRDGLYDIAGDFASSPMIYHTTDPFNDPYCDPADADPIGTAKDVDGDGEDGYSDNITNHMQ